MDSSLTKPLQDRTDSKLRYAAVHLQEIRTYGRFDGSDFDKAHQESFLFHLLSARDAFLAELNHYYDAGLPEENLSPGRLRDALTRKEQKSQELAALAELDADPDSWFSRAKAMRDHSAHVQGVPRTYYLGGENDGQVKLKHPKTGHLGEDHFVDEFSGWLAKMQALLHDLRRAALCGLGM